MKYLISSDIHGSLTAIKKILAAAKKENADKIILLGDVYYHGPRNPLPKGYAPMKVSLLLNEIADRLVVLLGNCDSEVDQMISKFTYVKSYVLEEGGKTVRFTHGHKENIDNPPTEPFDALVYGHFHKGFIVKNAEGKTFANCGSPSLPKDKFRGYLVLEDGVLTLKTLDGKTVTEQRI